MNSKGRTKCTRGVPEAAAGLSLHLGSRAQSHPLGFAASSGLQNPIVLWVLQKLCVSSPRPGRAVVGTHRGRGIDAGFMQVRNSVQPNKEYNFFMVHINLPCFPYKKWCLQLLPNSLASSPPLKVHSQLLPQLQLGSSFLGVNKAAFWVSSEGFHNSPLEGSSQHTPPWWCDLGTVQRVPG